jgi:hypothetical protein
MDTTFFFRLPELSSASLRNWNDGMMEQWNNGIMGDLVLLHCVQDKFTMLKEEKWDTGLQVKSLLTSILIKQ